MKTNHSIATFVFTLTASLAMAAAVHAATINSVTTSTSGNAITLDSVTVDGTAFNQADLINVTVTAVSLDTEASTPRALVVPDGESAPTTGSRAADTLEDFEVSSGLANVAPDAESGVNAGAGLVVSFNTQLSVSASGTADVLLFDMGTGDTVNILNKAGDSRVSFSTFNSGLLSTDMAMDLFDPADGNAITSLTELENDSLTTSVDLTQNLAGLAIDLTDLGYSEGDLVSSLDMTSDNSLDPVLIAAIIPEPSSALLLGLALCSVALRRRRR